MVKKVGRGRPKKADVAALHQLEEMYQDKDLLMLTDDEISEGISICAGEVSATYYSSWLIEELKRVKKHLSTASCIEQLMVLELTSVAMNVLKDVRGLVWGKKTKDVPQAVKIDSFYRNNKAKLKPTQATLAKIEKKSSNDTTGISLKTLNGYMTLLIDLKEEQFFEQYKVLASVLHQTFVDVIKDQVRRSKTASIPNNLECEGSVNNYLEPNNINWFIPLFQSLDSLAVSKFCRLINVDYVDGTNIIKLFVKNGYSNKKESRADRVFFDEMRTMDTDEYCYLAREDYPFNWQKVINDERSSSISEPDLEFIESDWLIPPNRKADKDNHKQRQQDILEKYRELFEDYPARSSNAKYILNGDTIYLLEDGSLTNSLQCAYG